MKIENKKFEAMWNIWPDEKDNGVINIIVVTEEGNFSGRLSLCDTKKLVLSLSHAIEIEENDNDFGQDDDQDDSECDDDELGIDDHDEDCDEECARSEEMKYYMDALLNVDIAMKKLANRIDHLEKALHKKQKDCDNN